MSEVIKTQFRKDLDAIGVNPECGLSVHHLRLHLSIQRKQKAWGWHSLPPSLTQAEIEFLNWCWDPVKFEEENGRRP